MSTQTHPYLVALVAVFVVAGCKDRAPVPKPAATASPHATGEIPLPDSHPPITTPAVKAPAPGETVDVGAIAFVPPAQWKFERPSSQMRRAQLKAPGADGDAELVVYFFGGGGAGSAQDNIDRWVGQFRNKDGSPIADVKPTEQKVGDFKVTRVEVAGQYSGGMDPRGQQQPGKSNQRLIATIVETPTGPYYFKFVGPNASVAENREAFDQLVASIEASP